MLIREQVVGRGQWGAGESNHGGNDAALPVYRGLIPTGEHQYACSDAKHGQYNKLLNRQYVALDENVEGEYGIDLEADNTSDADLGYTLFLCDSLLVCTE